MTDLPPQGAPPAPFGLDMPFDPDLELEAQLIERYGQQNPQVGFANHVTGALTGHDRTLGQHGRRLDAIDTWADGVNAFGQFQMELNGNLSRQTARSHRRLDTVEGHLTRTQVIELVAAIGLGIASVLFTLWVRSHETIGGVVVSQTLASWIAIALALAWIVIIAVMLIGWFRPHQDDEPVQNQQPVTPPEPPTDHTPAQGAPPAP